MREGGTLNSEVLAPGLFGGEIFQAAGGASEFPPFLTRGMRLRAAQGALDPRVARAAELGDAKPPHAVAGRTRPEAMDEGYTATLKRGRIMTPMVALRRMARQGNQWKD